jgi:hypothetical protein
MRNLAALQAEMTAAILDGDGLSLTPEITAPGADAVGRLGIYRNNTFLSLSNHLKAVFPVTARIGDERFFAYAAHEFIRSAPPREPRLATYGSGFAGFLASFPPCRGTQILPEMAALEWAAHSALISREEPPVTAAVLSGLAQDSGEIRLVLQPSLRFAVSRWPLLALWQGTNFETPLPRKISRVGLVRAGDSIRIFEPPPARFAFWRAIARGAPLDRAVARALARDPSFDPIKELFTLFGAGLVTGVDHLNSR